MIRVLASHYLNCCQQPSTMEDYEIVCKALLRNYKSLSNYVKQIVDHQNACKTDSHYRLQYHVSKN